MAFLNDTFTDTSGLTLTSHTGETGATWTEHASYAAGALQISNANRCRTGTVPTCYYASGTPTSAEFDVFADFDCISTSNFVGGIAARIDTAADTMYLVRYRRTSSPVAANWELVRVVTGTETILDTWADNFQTSETRAVEFRVRDALKSVYIDSVLRMSDADNTITAAGRVGIRQTTGNASNTTAIHYDSISAADPVAVDYLSVDEQPSQTEEGAAISPAVEVSKRLGADDTVDTSYTGNVTVAIGTNPSSGTLSGTLTVAAVAGVATFSDLEIDNPGAGYSLVFTASGLTSDESDFFDITLTPATVLAFSVQPADVQTGDPITPAVVVQARNPEGALDPNWTGDVQIAIGTNPTGATLSGTTTKTAVAGVATFNDLELDTAGAGFTLTATDVST